MAKSGKHQSTLSIEARRALILLCAEGAYGVAADDGEVVVVASRNGVSVRSGTIRQSALDALRSADLVWWEMAGQSGKQRLHVTQAGRAHAARLEAPAGADPWLAQHRPLGRPDGEDGALLDEAESPLAWLARRKDRNGLPLVDAACLEAGERLRRDLTIGALLPRVTANWSAAVASGARADGPAAFSETVISARQRARAALAAVGPDFAGLLLDICGFLKGLEAIERERGWPVRSGKLVLTLALRQLCRHYGLSPEARGNGARGLRHWGATDYRPMIPEELASA